jgi:hypothetical protein
MAAPPDLIRIINDFVDGHADFVVFTGQWDNCYHKLPDGTLSDSAERFFDEVDERLGATGEFGDMTVTDFKAWLVTQISQIGDLNA